MNFISLPYKKTTLIFYPRTYSILLNQVLDVMAPIKMVKINKYIDDADLDTKMEKILINGQGRLTDECGTCGGLLILHKEGACTRTTKENMEEMKNEKIELMAELMGRSEEFRMKRQMK